jgi:hypothetical protein
MSQIKMTATSRIISMMIRIITHHPDFVSIVTNKKILSHSSATMRQDTYLLSAV